MNREEKIKERIIVQKRANYNLCDDNDILKDKILFLENLVYDLINLL
jgi:hypothetical protein